MHISNYNNSVYIFFKRKMIHSSNFLKCLVVIVYDALMKIP